VRPTQTGTERESLEQMLDFFRATAMRKVAGLTDEQAAIASVPPSTLTPLGVLKHLTGTERFWFSIDFADLDLPHPWPEDDLHGAFGLEPGDTVASIVAAYAQECRRSQESVRDFALDETARAEGMDFTLRFAYLHMVEETARHCGHLDLLRECLDGTTGQ
jgi:Protein of unknown function (DUF664)